MSTKTIVKILIVIGLIVAVVEGVPQKGWHAFSTSGPGTYLLGLIGGEQHLSGLLRGPLDSIADSELTRNGVISSTNDQRDQQGEGPLHENPNLDKAAEAKVDDMFAQQYFEHVSPSGKSPADIIRVTGYNYIIVGENLALGNFKDDATLVQAWMDSPGHRANILNGKYQEIGVAVKKGTFEGHEVWLAVQEFGAPLSTCPNPQTGLKSKIDSNRSRLADNQDQLERRKADIAANKYASQDEYNDAVAKYNALVESTNQLSDETKELVSQYNASVNEFNKCLEANAE
jgi:Cysteine-rich secretory protein family